MISLRTIDYLKVLWDLRHLAPMCAEKVTLAPPGVIALYGGFTKKFGGFM